MCGARHLRQFWLRCRAPFAFLTPDTTSGETLTRHHPTSRDIP
jgi:hypothetical protein